MDIIDKVKLPEGCPPLNSYYVYLTGGCNLACKHCWLSPTFQPGGGTGGHLDYGLFELAIREGLPLGLSHVKLTGGEPLLHPDFLRMVDLLKQHNLGLTIETNGTLLDKKIARYLKETNILSFIAVSLDGASPESHDSFRGVKGSFEKACQAVRYLAEEGYRPQVIISVHNDNVGEAEAIVRLAEGLGAGSVKLGMVQAYGRGEKMYQQNHILDLYELVDFGKWVEEHLQKKAKIRVYYNWPFAFYSLKNLMSFDGYSCHIHNILGILHSGHLAMCGIGAHVPELCYGVLGKDHIFDVWAYHPLLVELREVLPAKLEGICGECILRTRCLGCCVAQNYHLSKRLTAPFWFCQMADKRGIFPASRKRSMISDIIAKSAEDNNEIPKAVCP